MIISVASGKGGTGKTLVATSLALALSKEHHVSILDCDVEEPNDHILLKPSISVEKTVDMLTPQIDESRCNRCGICADICVFNAIVVLAGQVMTFPQLCHSCGACAGLCPQQAINEIPRPTGNIRSGKTAGLNFVEGILNIGEAMAPPVIRQVKNEGQNSEIVIRDVPPGTSCPVVESIKGSDYCLLVTEPTPFGINDLKLAVALVRTLEIPCGVIINRTVTPDNCVAIYCREEKIDILLSIPLETEIARLYSRGITLVAGKPEWQKHFIKIYDIIRETLFERDSSIKR